MMIRFADGPLAGQERDVEDGCVRYIEAGRIGDLLGAVVYVPHPEDLGLFLHQP